MNAAHIENTTHTVTTADTAAAGYSGAEQAAPTVGTDAVQVHAHYASVKKLGHWTTATSFEVRARRGLVVLDLRSPQIPAGDVEIQLDSDHSLLKLLVAADDVVNHWDLHWQGRGKVKDHESVDTGTGRRIRIHGEVRHGEIRVQRGGVAQLTAMFSREYVDDVRRAHREGEMPAVDDPTRVA